MNQQSGERWDPGSIQDRSPDDPIPDNDQFPDQRTNTQPPERKHGGAPPGLWAFMAVLFVLLFGILLFYLPGR